jgi:hypothetical protein
MKVNLYWICSLLLFGCSTDYSDVQHPAFGVYNNKLLDEQIVILDESNYIHIYNKGKNKDTFTYTFNPGIEEVNYWGQIRFANFHDYNGVFSNRRINDSDSSVIYSFAYSPESFYTGSPVIVSDIEEVNKGFNLQ